MILYPNKNADKLIGQTFEPNKLSGLIVHGLYLLRDVSAIKYAWTMNTNIDSDFLEMSKCCLWHAHTKKKKF